MSHVVCQIPGVQGPQGPLGGAGLSVRKAVRVLGFYNKSQSMGPARDTVRIKTCLARNKCNRMKRRRPLVGVSGNAVWRKEKGSLVQIVPSENLQVKPENSHDQVANSSAPGQVRGWILGAGWVKPGGQGSSPTQLQLWALQDGRALISEGTFPLGDSKGPIKFQTTAAIWSL